MHKPSSMWTLLFVSLCCFAKTYGKDCPYPVFVPNGGFENGKLAPWYVEYDSSSNGNGDQTPNAVNVSIHSPGYKSKYALRLDAPRLEGDEQAGVTILQNTTGKVCYGYYYTLSVAYNWLHYVGPPAPDTDGIACSFEISTAYGSGYIYTTPSNKPGWHTASTTIRDKYSYCKNLEDTVDISTNCFTQYENSTGIPGYTLLVDDVRITPVKDMPPNPPLPTDPATCEHHS